MLFVMITHIQTYIYIDSIFINTLQSFMIPLFFLLSDIFFNDKLPMKDFMYKKINTLLIPFFFFYITCSIIISHILYLVGYNIRNTHFLGWHSLWYFIYPTKTFPNEPVWFLLSLFFVFCIFYFIVNLTRKLKYKFYIICLISLFCGIFGYFIGKLPLFLDETLTCIPYFCLGYILKQKTMFFEKNKINRYSLLLLSILLFVALYFMVYFFSIKIAYLGNIFSCNILLLYLTGIIGSISVILFSKSLNKIFIINYIGKNSLIVLCIILQALMILINKLNIINTLGTSFTYLLIIFILSILYYFVVPILSKLIPWFVAKKYLLKI